MMIMPKNWAVFQHYKDRCPPWIKLHRDLLNNREYMRLPLASKALAPLLWLLASESKTGEFDASVEELCFRLHMTEAEVIAGLKPLIDKGFFTGASNVLADCNQLAIPETETEREGETEKSTPKPPRGLSVNQEIQSLFEKFWQYYPKKVGKDAALKAFTKRKPDEKLLLQMLKALAVQKSQPNWIKEDGQYIPNPATWLNQGRWEDQVDSPIRSSIFAGGI
jgi:hypothetical protein